MLFYKTIKPNVENRYISMTCSMTCFFISSGEVFRFSRSFKGKGGGKRRQKKEKGIQTGKNERKKGEN